jgi:hypothetical protein
VTQPMPNGHGAVDHLLDAEVPAITLPTTDRGKVDLAGLGRPRTVLYVYPMIGRPGMPAPDGRGPGPAVGVLGVGGG